MRKFAICLIAALLCVLSGQYAQVSAGKITKINTCWMDECHGFAIWYAKQKGWDKEEGLDINMLLFGSGVAQMEALPSRAWQLGGTSTPGYLIGALRYNAYMISPNINEGYIQGVWARPDSPIFKVKGYNPDYPDVYGSPETVKGSTILYTSQTTVHYIVGNWLKILGLKESDVKLVNMDQPSTIPAYEKGVGDAIVVWSPFTFAAANHGWKEVASMAATKAVTSGLYVGDKKWCDKHPDLVAKFLKIHYRAVNEIRKGFTPGLMAQYQTYMKDFCGIKMNAQDAKKDLETHPYWTYEEAMALSKPDQNGISPAWQMQLDTLKFFVSLGRYTQKDADKLEKHNLFNTKFMNMLK